jgi:hypothetical protein
MRDVAFDYSPPELAVIADFLERMSVGIDPDA